MMTATRMISAGLLALAAAASPPQAKPPNRDPDRAQLVTSDIPNFWRVFDQASLRDAADVFQRGYIDPGTVGLHDFLKGRIQNGRMLAATVAARPAYYAAIRESTLAVARNPAIEQAIRRVSGASRRSTPTRFFRMCIS
jgi:hypothetical protein